MKRKYVCSSPNQLLSCIGTSLMPDGGKSFQQVPHRSRERMPLGRGGRVASELASRDRGRWVGEGCNGEGMTWPARVGKLPSPMKL